MAKTIPIPAKDISVLIQGPLLTEQPEGIHRCLQSLRQQIPAAEIVIATWENEHPHAAAITGADRIVYLTDPGADFVASDRPYNFTRMVSSTATGIDLCTRPYILKFRADCALSSTRFLTAHPSPAEGQYRINTTNYFMPNPEVVPFLFHISDTVQFGRKEDIRALWNNGFNIKPFIRTTDDNSNAHPWKVTMLPEQALALAWINAMGAPCRIERPYEVSAENCAIWISVIKSLLQVYIADASGIIFPEKFHQHKDSQIDEEALSRIAHDQFGYDGVMRSAVRYIEGYISRMSAK